MTSGYHQLEVHPDDRHYLTVICQAGRFRYNVVSQGIISASDFWYGRVACATRYSFTIVFTRVLLLSFRSPFSAASYKKLKETKVVWISLSD